MELDYFCYILYFVITIKTYVYVFELSIIVYQTVTDFTYYDILVHSTKDLKSLTCGPV